MKKAFVFAVAALVLSSIPALAQDNPQEHQEEYRCQLQAGNCTQRIDKIRRKMKKIQAEAKKGKVYSAEDLKKIEDKLKEVEQMLDNLKAQPTK